MDYYSEEVRLIRDQMSFEYNLTQRERIDRVIYELEAERLFVPQRWIKMSPDVVEKREDPDFIYSTETKKMNMSTSIPKRSAEQMFVIILQNTRMHIGRKWNGKRPKRPKRKEGK